MINSKRSRKSDAVANLSSAKVIVAWMSRNSHLEKGGISAKCGCSQKRVREMIRRYNKKLPIDKYSQHRSILWPVWLNGWVFIYKLSSCGFESRCIDYYKFRYCACFEQGVPWHSGNYRVWTHSKRHTWHDRNIQSCSANFTNFTRENLWWSLFFVKL